MVPVRTGSTLRCSMDPDRIDACLAAHGCAPHLRARIEDLLSGREDRRRLHCCNSGCVICVRTLLAILGDLDGTAPAPSAAPARGSAPDLPACTVPAPPSPSSPLPPPRAT
jgi:hypothetical protein